MSIRTIRRTVTLAETPDGWLWREHGRSFVSLGKAVAAVNRDSKEMVQAGVGAVITTISYEPQTLIGRAVVRAITESQS